MDELSTFDFDKYFCFFNDDDDEDFFHETKYEYTFYINIAYEFWSKEFWIRSTYTSRGVGNKFETYVYLQKMFESFLYNFTKYIWFFFYPIISRMNLDLESKRIFFNTII